MAGLAVTKSQDLGDKLAYLQNAIGAILEYHKIVGYYRGDQDISGPDARA